MLWGLAESGKELTTDLGDKTSITIILTRIAHDGITSVGKAEITING